MWPISAKDEVRFWRGVSKSNGCWSWVKSRIVAGYGKIMISGKMARAHRIAWSFDAVRAVVLRKTWRHV